MKRCFLTEIPLNKIRKKLQSIPGENRNPDTVIDEVKGNILKFVGIEEVPIAESITRFDHNLHDEYEKDNNREYKDRVVVKVVKKGTALLGQEKSSVKQGCR